MLARLALMKNVFFFKKKFSSVQFDYIYANLLHTLR